MLNSVQRPPRSSGALRAEVPAHAPAVGRREGIGFELPLLALLLIFLAFAYSQPDVIEPVAANITAALSLMAIMAFGCRRLLKADPMAIWSPMLWLRVAYATYYGFGALVPYIANNATVAYMQALFLFSDDDVLKVNLINVAALICILIGTRVAALHLRARNNAPRHQATTGSLELFAVIFLLAGGIARYAIVLPFTLGFAEGFVPSIANAMARSYSAGLMLLVIMALRKGRLLLLIAAVLVSIDLFVGVLLFSKSDVLVTILFVLLALYHQRPSIVRLGAGAAVAIMVFALLAPMIGYGRDRVTQIGGGRQTATLEDRWNTLKSYLQGDAQTKPGEDEIQIALSRLSYMNAGTMTVAWRDLGRPGSTFEHALAAVVPRLLWPDKPDITATGRNLYIEATGFIGASISPGLPAEAYWNFGWWGIPVLMLPLGIVLALLAHAATSIMANERWLFLPVVLMSIQVGTRVDGQYVADVIGASVTIGVLYLLLRGLDIVFFSRGAQG